METKKPTPGPFGALKCGCTIVKLGQFIDIEFCSMHDAAPALLAGLDRVLGALGDEADITDSGRPNQAMRLMTDLFDTGTPGGAHLTALLNKAGGK